MENTLWARFVHIIAAIFRFGILFGRVLEEIELEAMERRQDGKLPAA